MNMCAWCHGPMGDTKRRRTCSNRCRKALSRELKQERRSYYTRARSVTPGDTPYEEPPRPPGSFYQASVGDERFHRQLAAEGTRATPLSDAERTLVQRQRRNVGVALPELQQIALDHEYDRRHAEAAEAARADPIRVQDQLDPSTYGYLARRAQQSRSRNKPQDPNLHVLRPPGQSARYPGDLPETINAPPRNTPRWLLG